MGKYIVEIKGEIVGDYEIIGKYEDRLIAKWIGKDGEYQCNKCYGKLWYRSDYCPQCGARMEVADADTSGDV